MSSSTSIQNQKFSRVGTFADLLVRYIRERKDGDAPAVYNAARIDRRTYSSIVSNPFRAVSKRTVIQFALALQLKRSETDRLLLVAGYALSPAIPEDTVFAAFISSGEYDFFKINERLDSLGMRVVL